MSCYIVTDTHLSAIIGWARRNKVQAGWGRHNGASPGYAYRPGLEQEAMNILLDANVASVNARYKEVIEVEPMAYQTSAPHLSAIEVIKACDCLAYQCDEWEGFVGSAAQKLLYDIQCHAIRKLPGYDEAAWSIK